MEARTDETLGDSLEHRQLEVERLQHGIAVLDLFEREIVVKDDLTSFCNRTRPGTETRTAILEGSYKGDEEKLEGARFKAYKGYSVDAVKRKGLYVHALYLGMDAELTSTQVIVRDKDDWNRLSKEHGEWRARFASKQRDREREMQIGFLQSRIRFLKGEQATGLQVLEVGPHVNITDRAVLYTHAINAMCRRSMLSGFGVGVADPKHNEEIFKRYEDDTAGIDTASMHKVDRLLVDVKRDFWRMSGFLAIRRSGLMGELELRRRAQKMWQEFQGQHEHAPQQKERERIREQIAPLIPPSRLAATKIK